MTDYRLNLNYELHRSTDNGTTFTILPGLEEWQNVKAKREKIEVTNFQSPGLSREFIEGLYDETEAEFTFIYTDAVYDALVEDEDGYKADDTLGHYRLVFPGRGGFTRETHTFTAIPTVMRSEDTKGTAAKIVLTLNLTGEVVIARPTAV